MAQRKFLNTFLIVLVVLICIQILIVQAKAIDEDVAITKKLTSTLTDKVHKHKQKN